MSNALVIKDPRERISKRLKAALDRMVWADELGHTMEWYEAARAVGILKESMRRSLRRPVVRRYLRTEQEVFRATLSTKIPARLGELAMQDENRNAAVAACRTVLGQDDEHARLLTAPSPHMTIQIVNVAPPAPVVEHIEPAPLPEPEPQRYDDQGHLLPVFRNPLDRDR